MRLLRHSRVSINIYFPPLPRSKSFMYFLFTFTPSLRPPTPFPFLLPVNIIFYLTFNYNKYISQFVRWLNINNRFINFCLLLFHYFLIVPTIFVFLPFSDNVFITLRFIYVFLPPATPFSFMNLILFLFFFLAWSFSHLCTFHITYYCPCFSPSPPPSASPTDILFIYLPFSLLY